MAGQSGSLNVSFSSSGAGGVVADATAIKAALDGVKGGEASVRFRSDGAAGATREARAFNDAMRGARESAAGVGRESERAHRATSGLGREASSARAHVRGLRDDMRALAAGADSVNQRMAIGGPAGEMRRELGASSRSMRELESGAGRAAIAAREIRPGGSGGAGGGAMRESIMDMHQLADGTWGVADAMRAIEARSSGAASGAKAVGGGYAYAEGVPPRAEGVYSKAHEEQLSREAAGGGAPTRQWGRASQEIDEVGKASGRAGGKVAGLGSMLNKAGNASWPAAAGVAMFAGTMESATNHAVDLGKATAGLGMSYDNMGKMLSHTMEHAARGQSSGKVTAMDADLKQTARTATNELAPAIGGAIDATHALTKAGLEAWGGLSPNIAGFAQTVQSNAGPAQQIMHSLGATALSMGAATVQGVSDAAGPLSALGAAVQNSQQQLSSMVHGGVSVLSGAGQAATNLTGNVVDTGQRIGASPVGQAGIGLLHAGGVRTDSKSAPYGIGVSPSTLKSMARLGPIGGIAATALAGVGMVDTGGGAPSPQADAGAGTSRAVYGSSGAEGRSDRHDAAVQKSREGLDKYIPPGSRGILSGGGVVGGGPGSGVMSKSSSGFAALRREMQQTGAAANTSMSQVGGAVSSGAQRVQGATQHMSSGVHQASQGFQQMPPAAGQAFSGVAHQAQSSNMGGAVQSATRQMVRHINQAAPDAEAGGQNIGAAVGGGTAAGITKTENVPVTVIRKLMKRVITEGMDAISAKSPSRLAADKIGAPLPQGVGAGIAENESAATGPMRSMLATTTSYGGQAYAAGREIGVTYATGMGDGARQAQFRTTNLQAINGVDLQNQQALAALGRGGYYGAAGSGAMQSKATANIAQLGASAGGGTTTIEQVHKHYISLDGGPFREMADALVETAMTQLKGMVGRQ